MLPTVFGQTIQMTIKLLMLITLTLFVAPHWTVQTSGVNVRLRGVSAVTENVAWASGAGSTVLRTVDGGTTWQKLTVTSDTLDFRDVDAVDAQTAYVLAIGNGPASRIYKTIDAGKTWTLQFKNEDPKAFLDAMSFWDANNGIVFGDSVDGQLYILMTNDGGRVWTRVKNTEPAPCSRKRRRVCRQRHEHRRVWKITRMDRYRRSLQSSRVAHLGSWTDLASGRYSSGLRTIFRNLFNRLSRCKAWRYRRG